MQTNLEWQKAEQRGVGLGAGGKDYKQAQENFWEWCMWLLCRCGDRFPGTYTQPYQVVHFKYVQLIVCQLYHNKTIFLKIWAIQKADLMTPLPCLKCFKGCWLYEVNILHHTAPLSCSPLFLLFYSHILLEHNLPRTHFIAFGHAIPFCWDVLFPNLF